MKRTIADVLVLVVALVGAVVALQPPKQPESAPIAAEEQVAIRDAAQQVDQVFAESWANEGVEPLRPADPMLVARRLSLALCGTVPSLEEIRAIEALPADQQVDSHLERLLADRRFADYLAERLARAFVGTEDGPFLVYRRRRFVYWLSDALIRQKGDKDYRAYDELVREIISAEGLWTDHPATNFVTARVVPDQGPDPLALAARTTRAFLGVRIDCAQCHDHPFAEWSQRDFEGLAAYFVHAKQSFRGVEDKAGELKVEDMKTKQEREVAPRVPFNESDVESPGRRREQLAAWITSDSNPYFAKAIANRVWTLMFGQGIVEPVDDLEAEPRVEGVLDALADDFRTHGYDLRRLVRVIAATQAFRAAASCDGEVTESQEKLFAAFPLVRLRSEQIAGSLIQVSSLRTVDADSHVFIRFLRAVNTADFVKHYGDAGEEELNAHVGTIPQRLVMLNGKMPRERIEAGPMSAGGRITSLSPSDPARVRTAYLVCLTRPPTADEEQYFVARLNGLNGDEHKHAVEDMMWSLVNSTEFSWNH